MKFLNALAVPPMILLLAGCEVFNSGQPSATGNPPLAPSRASRPAPPPPSHAQSEPWMDVSISVSERQVIQSYVNGYVAEEKHPGKGKGKGKKPKSLPPGLQKKLDRGGSLPPGWEKKMRKGEIVPVEVYEQCHPLPQEVIVKLPPPPPGTILISIGGKVARLLAATREILDVFEVEY